MTPDEQLEVISAALLKLGQPLPQAAYDSSSFNHAMQRLGPQPAYSAMLGRGDDGLPIMVDLSDPRSGSILVMGEQGLEILPRAICASAASLNHPDQVSFTIISPDHCFDDLARLAHCQALISSYDRRSAQAVIEMAAVAEQRRSGRERGAVHVLAIHDLPALLQYREYDTAAYLRWLIEFGPRLGVVPFVTIPATEVPAIQTQEPRLLPLFVTRIAAVIPAYVLSMRGGETCRLYPLVA